VKKDSSAAMKRRTNSDSSDRQSINPPNADLSMPKLLEPTRGHSSIFFVEGNLSEIVQETRPKKYANKQPVHLQIEEEKKTH